MAGPSGAQPGPQPVHSHPQGTSEWFCHSCLAASQDQQRGQQVPAGLEHWTGTRKHFASQLPFPFHLSGAGSSPWQPPQDSSTACREQQEQDLLPALPAVCQAQGRGAEPWG